MPGRLLPKDAIRSILHRIFVAGACYLTTVGTAEPVKRAESAYRDVNLASANGMAQVCEAMNIKPRDMVKLANHNPRVNILQPGPGVDGHCIPIAPWLIVDSVPNSTPLIQIARQVNDGEPERVPCRQKSTKPWLLEFLW